MDSQKDHDSLYRRLGGYDTIAAIIADQFRLLKEDERFRRFAQGRGLDSRARAQQLTVEQICALAGGPCLYLGRDMKTSHRGLGITAEEWDAYPCARQGKCSTSMGSAYGKSRSFWNFRALPGRYRGTAAKSCVNANRFDQA